MLTAWPYREGSRHGLTVAAPGSSFSLVWSVLHHLPLRTKNHELLTVAASV